MLPEGWKRKTVADICHMQNGNGFGPQDWGTEGYPIIRIQNLNGGSNFDYYSGPVEQRWLVETGQLLFAWAGTKGVSFGPTIWKGRTGVLNQHIFKVNARDGIDKTWLYWALRHTTDRIEASAHGFKATLVHVKKSDIDRQEVLVPDLQTQRWIAQVLQTWDDAISAAERLLANSRKQKQALMQDLLFNREEPYQELPLSEIAERVQRKSDGEGHPVLMISSGTGFVRQDEKYSRFMAGKSLNDYILLSRGEFAYNKGNSKLYEFGCVFPLEQYEWGLVPHVYVCFRLDGRCHPDFFKFLFEADYLHDQLGALVNTGVRNNGLLNIRPADFMNVMVPLPPIARQQYASDVLTAASREIKLQQEDLEALRLQKRALMADLVTGKRRIRLPESMRESEAA
jgi:type I restriction enzyme S subunit